MHIKHLYFSISQTFQNTEIQKALSDWWNMSFTIKYLRNRC